MISYPLQTVLFDLQSMWYCLDGERINNRLAKPPNVAIGNIMMVGFKHWIHYSFLMEGISREESSYLV